MITPVMLGMTIISVRTNKPSWQRLNQETVRLTKIYFSILGYYLQVLFWLDKGIDALKIYKQLHKNGKRAIMLTLTVTI